MVSRFRFALAVGALSLAALQPASGAALPDRVTHGTADVYLYSYGRCNSVYIWSLTGTFLVGPDVWRGKIGYSTCYESGQGSDVMPSFTGSSSDGQLTSTCASNIAADPFLARRGAGRGALACLMSVDDGQPFPVVLELQTHAFYDTSGDVRQHVRTGSFYGA